MNNLYLQGVFAERVEFKVVDEDYFSVHYGNEYPVRMTKEDAQELIGFLSEFVDGEI